MHRPIHGTLPNATGKRALIVQWQKGEPVTVFPPEKESAKPIWATR